MKRIKLQYFITHISMAILLANGYIHFSGSTYSYKSVSDSLAIFGLLYLISGLFRFVRKLHFFDSYVFGAKKLWEIITVRSYTKRGSKVGEYVDYLANNVYTKPYFEFLLVGSILLCCSLVLLLFI
ncbi:MAG: DUF3899 domain-containing protein [Alkaliphilus sp.]